MKVFKNQSNFEPTKGKTFTQPSLTVPDQTMSMRTLLDRYAKGLPIADAKEPIYDEDPELSSGINPRSLDLVDLQELKMKTDEKISKLKKKRQDEEREFIEKAGQEAGMH